MLASPMTLARGFLRLSPGRGALLLVARELDRDAFADSRARSSDDGNLEWIGHARNGNMTRP